MLELDQHQPAFLSNDRVSTAITNKEQNNNIFSKGLRLIAYSVCSRKLLKKDCGKGYG